MEKAAKVKLDSDLLYQVLFCNSADTWLLLNPAGDIIDANHRALKSYAYSPDGLGRIYD